MTAKPLASPSWSSIRATAARRAQSYLMAWDAIPSQAQTRFASALAVPIGHGSINPFSGLSATPSTSARTSPPTSKPKVMKNDEKERGVGVGRIVGAVERARDRAQNAADGLEDALELSRELVKAARTHSVDSLADIVHRRCGFRPLRADRGESEPSFFSKNADLTASCEFLATGFLACCIAADSRDALQLQSPAVAQPPSPRAVSCLSSARATSLPPTPVSKPHGASSSVGKRRRKSPITGKWPTPPSSPSPAPSSSS